MDFAKDILRPTGLAAQVPGLETALSLAIDIIKTVQVARNNTARLQYLAHLVANHLITIEECARGRWDSAPGKLKQYLDEYEAILCEVSKDISKYSKVSRVAAFYNSGDRDMHITRLEKRLDDVQKSIILLLEVNTSLAVNDIQTAFDSHHLFAREARLQLQSIGNGIQVIQESLLNSQAHHFETEVVANQPSLLLLNSRLEVQATTSPTKKAGRGGFYAVHKGHKPGVYISWNECEKQVKGYSGAEHKRFSTETEAKEYVEFGTTGSPAAVEHAMATPYTEVNRTWDTVYVHGACNNNGTSNAVAGFGVSWGVGDPRSFAERCHGKQTNKCAELMAVIRALEKAPPSGISLHIMTNSNYPPLCIGWKMHWEQHGWKTTKGKLIENQAPIKALFDLIERRNQGGQGVTLEHVRGMVETIMQGNLRWWACRCPPPHCVCG